MKLTMLGTGNAMVTECYNTCFMIDDGGKLFMVDGGGGNRIFKQLKDASFDFRNIHEIFVTHKHVDHIMGIIWMVRLICQNMDSGRYEGEANIYGHSEVIGLIRSISEMLLQKKQTKYFDSRLHLIEVEDGESRIINGRRFTFFDIGSTKAKQFGFCMEYDGKKLSCCGDEPFNEAERKYAQDSTWLLHEAFCLSSQADIFKPYEKHHSAVKDACQLAESLNAENVILYHTEDKNIKKRRELYTEEGRKYFDGGIFVPDDLDTIDLDA